MEARSVNQLGEGGIGTLSGIEGKRFDGLGGGYACETLDRETTEGGREGKDGSGKNQKL